jgi:Smg protein
MKENILDVLMYLFENYMDNDVERNPDQETLKLELVEAGFTQAEINKAFIWLEGLAVLQDGMSPETLKSSRSIRIFTDQEAEKLGIECRGFLLFLEQVGVLDQGNRELVIDRVMALETEEIDLEQLKWVVLMVLFNQPGQEAAFAWVEDLVYDETAGTLH